MIIQIDHEKLLKILLNGNWFDCRGLSKEDGDELKLQDPEGKLFSIQPCLLDDCHGTPYYELWSIEGWNNEMERRLYISKLYETNPDSKPLEKPKSKTEKELKQELSEALEKALETGDYSEVAKIKEQLYAIK